MANLPPFANNLIIGADVSNASGRNCVVVGRYDAPEFGENLFHVAGVVSRRVRSPHWAAAVAEAREECWLNGIPVAFEPLCELANAPIDDVRRALIGTLHRLRQKR